MASAADVHCCSEWLMFSPSWVIAMDRYVITTLCYVLWLGSHATGRLGVGGMSVAAQFLNKRQQKSKTQTQGIAHF